MSNYSKHTVTNDENEVFVKLSKLIPDGSTVLDIGCGPGFLGEHLAATKHCVVDGVEPDKADATKASKRLRHIWELDIEAAIEEIKERYDVLVFADVIEHLVNPADVLKRVGKLLKPNGSIVFSVPNMAHVSLRLSLLEGNFKYTEVGLLDKTHLHFYDIDTVKMVFQDAGMTLTTIDSVTYKYPEELLKSRLQALGLSATKKGIEILSDEYASAFQYVGSASYSKAKSTKLQLPKPLLNTDIYDFVEQSRNERKELRAEIEKLQYENKDLQNRLTVILNSKSYKFAKKISNTKGKISKPLKRS